MNFIKTVSETFHFNKHHVFLLTQKMTSHKGYFSTYQSPNIVIDPNNSNYLIVKKMKADNRVNTNLKILQDNKMSELYTEVHLSCF